MLRDGSARVAALGPAQLSAARRDPLLTTDPGPGRATGSASSARCAGSPRASPAPPLNAVWLTAIDAG